MRIFDGILHYARTGGGDVAPLQLKARTSQKPLRLPATWHAGAGATIQLAPTQNSNAYTIVVAA